VSGDIVREVQVVSRRVGTLVPHIVFIGEDPVKRVPKPLVASVHLGALTCESDYKPDQPVGGPDDHRASPSLSG
jgi:hypothetical protein